MTLFALGRRYPAIGTVVSGAANRGLLPIPRRTIRHRLGDGRVLVLRAEDNGQRQMALARFEPAETALLPSLLRPGDAYVDVGAHVGWFVLLAARAVGPAGSVFAFEAFPPNERLLRRNLELNHTSSVRLVHAAVAAEPGTATIAVQASGDSGSPTLGPRARGRRFEVPQTTLDASVPADVDPALIKIDVEGFEEHVLQGGAGVLARTRAVLVELNDGALRANGSSPDRIRELLADTGLTTQTLLSEGATRLSATSMPNLLATREPAPVSGPGVLAGAPA